MQNQRDLSFRNSTPQRGRNRGRGRGGSLADRTSGGEAGIVPNIRQIIAGSFVSIVLKADQGTGREVQGVVQDVLTSGNHPRGIKVRLRDGRVGRVQRMVNEEQAMAGQEGLRGLGENGEVGGASGYGGSSWRSRAARGESDLAGERSIPRSSYSLEDFLPTGHPLLDEPRRDEFEESPDYRRLGAGVEIQVCPVCGEFEGDEAAVSHHVNGHFEGS